MKGTPNKVTTTLRGFIQNLIDDNRGRIMEDLNKLDPYRRLFFIERLIGYVLPKQASVDIEVQIEAERKALERLIDEAPEEFIDEITNRIMKLKKDGNE